MNYTGKPRDAKGSQTGSGRPVRAIPDAPRIGRVVTGQSKRGKFKCGKNNGGLFFEAAIAEPFDAVS